MRGSHEGSFDVAHALADGRFWASAPPPRATGESYDLVVVGAGISGLAAAFFYRERMGRNARILLLDNHDDFGGHAKRNLFRPKGRLLIANGGTAAIDSPFPYSRQALGLLKAVGIDLPALAASAKLANGGTFADLRRAFFFDRETFGADRLVVGVPRPSLEGDSRTWAEWLAKTPLSAAAQRDIARLEVDVVDFMPGLTSEQKKDALSRVSYEAFLLDHVRVDPSVIPFYQARTHDLYGVGIDAVGALECWAYGYPGFRGMNLDPGPTKRMSFTARGAATEQETYGYHFPDGNATVARLLVRALVPLALPGSTAEGSVTARLDYRELDRQGARVRLRLRSTAVRVRHVGSSASAREVEIVYSRQNELASVRAKGVVLACWNMIVPLVCDELPEAQKDALRYGVKVPLVYTTVALRNWEAFQNLGVSGALCPGMYHASVRLEQPTEIGSYAPTPSGPGDPVLLRMFRTPCKPGLPAREQHRAGHRDLYTTTFQTFERKIREQLARILGAGGFDPSRDIDAITVNRWPHGYAYEYNPLWDPEWRAGESPCEIGRAPLHRIAIANSDAAAAAYTDVAIDQGHRAVEELVKNGAV